MRCYQRLVVVLLVLPLGSSTASRAGDLDQSGFVVPKGCIVEKAAGQPLVNYPLFACFDDQGRLYVAEGTGLNAPGEVLLEKKLGRITLLEDSDRDGRFDTSTTFADGLVFPQGVLWHDGAVYTASHPNIWKLEDVDGDGRADRREALVGKFGFNGNGCDIHGPFFGPDGYLYWTDGRHSHQIRCREGYTLQGLAARVFRCRLDGQRIERIAGGGFDNPVELIFSPEGTIIGTMDQGVGDCLLHYVEGGVYPRMDHPCVAEFTRTGPALSPVKIFPENVPPALCGLTRLRSTHIGPDYQGSLLTAQFNVHKVQQHVLTADGATWRAGAQEFLEVLSHDSHPSDVLEDADGSILVVDMGAWFNYGCPTSKIAKPEVKGTIYRVRRRDAPKIDDPWGNQIEWQALSIADLVKLLNDSRLRVQDRAAEQLIKREAESVESLSRTYGAAEAPLEVRRRVVWAMSRIDTPEARQIVRSALTDEVPSLRHIALHCVGLRRDTEAMTALEKIVVSDEPALRLKAAEALGRIGNAQIVPALLESLRSGATDRFLEHSLIYALIQIGDRQATLPALDDLDPDVRRAGMVALDQMAVGKLTWQMVASCLNTDDPQLRQVALEILSKNEELINNDGLELSEQLVWWLNTHWLAVTQPSEDLKGSVIGALINLSEDEAIQQLIADVTASAETSVERRLLVLEVMARCRLDKLPASWLNALAESLSHEDLRVRSETVATIRSRGLDQFDEELLKQSRKATEPIELRVAALDCIAGRSKSLPNDSFQLLTSQLGNETSPLLRASAARALGASILNEQQLIELATFVAEAGPLLVPILMPAYQKTRSGKVGRVLVSALSRSPGAESLTADDLDRLLKDYPQEIGQASRSLFEKLTARGTRQADYLAEIKTQLAEMEGDLDRGRQVFFSKRAACVGCHRMGEEGGRVGPDLSKIAHLRSPNDLVESLLFPSSSIAPDFRSYTIADDDGQVYTGLIVRETSQAIYLRTAQLAEIRIPRSRVDAVQHSNVSVMPRGLEKSLSMQELSDLLTFLSQRRK